MEADRKGRVPPVGEVAASAAERMRLAVAGGAEASVEAVVVAVVVAVAAAVAAEEEVVAGAAVSVADVGWARGRAEARETDTMTR
jgi:hypothetical protein